MLPSADMVARRERLRGLGKELQRVYLLCFKGLKKVRYNCAFPFQAFIKAADLDLHSILTPYADAALVETHGEQLLEQYIRLASELDWKEWMRASVEVAATAGNTHVFRRLLGVGPSIPELCAQHANRAYDLLCSAARGGSMDIFSFLVAIDGFFAFARGRPAYPDTEAQIGSWTGAS